MYIIMNIIILLVIITKLNGRVSGLDYCGIKCDSVEHTLCGKQYPVGGGDQCRNNDKVYLTENEKRTILEYHNKKRIDLSMKTMSVSNMKKLVWNGNLGAMAKRWADQCGRPLHDVCRTKDGLPSGQNSYIGYFWDSKTTGMSLLRERHNTINNILEVWFHEGANVRVPGDINSYNVNRSEAIGNYTQMVWANTLYIGCGYTEFTNENKKSMFRFICNYHPTGNVANQSVYTFGASCSNCSKGYNCSTTYSGLCWNGEENDFADNKGSFKTSLVCMVYFLFTATLVYL